MDNNSASLDKWRIYFKTANADIFGIIEHAVMVAAMDFPNELKLKRASIAEMLFTCRVTRCFGCNNVELALPNVYDEEVQAKCNANAFNEEFKTGKSNDGKTAGVGNDRVEMELNGNQISNCSSEDAEALSDENEEEFQAVVEVMRIKQSIDNHGEESESLVIDSLRRLQLMVLSIDTLKITDIGKSVNALRKQESKEIKLLVRELIGAWKATVDEWVAKETESTPESVKASAVEEEEEGLPSPPLDEGFFLTSNTMELSQFFDDMDDDGNLQESGELNKNGRKTSLQKPQLLKGSVAPPQDRYTEQAKEPESELKKPIMAAPQDLCTKQPKKEEGELKKPVMAAPDWYTKQPVAAVKKASNDASEDWYTPQATEQQGVKQKSRSSKPNKPSANGSGRMKGSAEMKFQPKSVKATIDKRRSVSQQSKLKSPDEISIQATLEVAKRKLQERRYQSDEDAKKPRRNQFVETPRQSVDHRNTQVKAGNYSKQWTNGSR